MTKNPACDKDSSTCLKFRHDPDREFPLELNLLVLPVNHCCYLMKMTLQRQTEEELIVLLLSAVSSIQDMALHENKCVCVSGLILSAC